MSGFEAIARATGRPADVSDALAFGERIAATSSRVLGEILASVIIHGSLTLDDYAPGRSDVDLLGIIERPLSDPEVESLIRALAVERDRAPCPVDLRLVTRAVAARPPESPPMELYLRLGGSAGLATEARLREPDLLVELSVSREHGRALVGASPHELIGAVPHDWVVGVGDAQLARWQSLTDDAPYAELMVLTACRVWRLSEERIHCSKSEAGRWALVHDPSLRAVRDALRQRAGDTVRIEPTEIGRLLTLVRGHISPPERQDGST